MAFPSTSQIEQIIADSVQARQMDIERIRINKAGKKSLISIAVGSDNSPGTADLEELSREISALLDQAEESGEINCGPGYTLEITSPGVDFPLTLVRHWRRNRFRLVQLKGSELKGSWRIGALSDNAEDSEDTAQVALVSHDKNPRIQIVDLTPPLEGVVEIEFAQCPPVEQDLCALSFEEAKERQGSNK